MNNDARGTYNQAIQIKFKTSTLKSILCDYSDAYILAKGTISIEAQSQDNLNNGDKEVVFKLCSIY